MNYEDGEVRVMKEFKNQPRVLVGYPTGEFARQAIFYDTLHHLQLPAGTGMTTSHGQSPARGRNLIIKEAIRGEYTHIFFMDDDIIFPPDTLIKLLTHDRDMVTGLYTMRSYPHAPIIFDIANEDGSCRHRFLNDDDNGLIPVVAAGLGCCLIKTEVFKAMDENPNNRQQWIRLGELERDHWCDDIGFFKRASEAGFQLYCDLETRVGHMGVVAIWPNHTNGAWLTSYDTFGVKHVSTPQLKSVEEAAKLNLNAKPLWDKAFRGKEDDSFRDIFVKVK